MMKLSLMRDVSATADADWHSSLADAILSCWAHDEDRPWFVRSSANVLFGFRQNGRDCFLRFNHASERTPELVQAELDYLIHLHAAGLRVAQPLPSLAGNLIESVDTALGMFHAVVFERVLGEALEIATLTPALFAKWGRALGELHQAATNYHRIGRLTWRDQLEALEDGLPEQETAARQAAKLLHRQLAALPINTDRVKDNFGLIHFDFELDNLLWDGERFGLIDFDDCAWHWYAADIAFALRDIFDDDPAQVNLQQRSVLAFVGGYRQTKALRQEELHQMPLFLRLHNLIMFAKLLRAMDAGDAEDDPTWLSDLRHKLQNKVVRYRAGFVAQPMVAPIAKPTKPIKKPFAERIKERMQALEVAHVDELIPTLLSGDLSRAGKALSVLVTQAQSQHASALIAFLSHTDDTTQIHEVAEALIRLQKQQVNLLQPLIDYMLCRDYDAELREWVAYALTHEYPALPRIWHERLSRAFCHVLGDASEMPSLRAQTGEGLAEIYELHVKEFGRTRQYRRAGELLIQMLNDPAPEVRFWSCFALGKMRYRPALRALNTLANKDSATHGQWWSVGEEAADAIDWIKGRQSPDRNVRPISFGEV